ncbi:uncharacterized protein LOC127856627 isoform X2 [Dreissena polymorpha]|uniref:uncharacterized protein LOC127856627 isoform X2 n=1 Tax=Dreissena polymorpha TaxID=45954 RepID=UPI002264DF11|nr:uncharacterized protein LOC127856627 isoform X2 [Dreissena polymorpha]
MASRTEELNMWSDSISSEERHRHELLFYSQGPVDGYLLGERARDLFLHSRLPLTVLSQIWNLCDVSNDNVLSVDEFVLAMYLIRKVSEGLAVPRILPKHLVPSPLATCDVPDMSPRERSAYQSVFSKISKDTINALQGRQLLLESQLPQEELSHVWDLSDVNRDGQLDRVEWNVTCHLIRYLKKGHKLEGPVNVFPWIPDRLSSTSYLARKLRVEEYFKRKTQLIAQKEKRKIQIDNEIQRLDLLKKRLALHKELFQCSKKLPGHSISEEEFNLYQEKEKNNIDKVEAIIYRLKKEHERIRQETVRAILSEQGPLQEDGHHVKRDQEELRQRLMTFHTKATKDPDPFHQLYELRRDLRKRSTLSEDEEPAVHFPFVFNPFRPEGAQPCLSGHTIFVSPDPSVLNNNNSHKELPILEDLCHFGDGFLERWSSPDDDTSGIDFDPIFMSLNVPMDNNAWSGLEWVKKDDLDPDIEVIHKKLVDLKAEMQKLNGETGGQLLFRNPEDYLAKQKAEAEGDRVDKSKYQRRSKGETRTDPEREYRRRSLDPSKLDAESNRDAQNKRTSLNLDPTSRASGIPVAPAREGRRRPKSTGGNLEVSTETSDAFVPESASSPVHCPVSPPSLPSTKRRFAPAPPQGPNNPSASTTIVPSAGSKIPTLVKQPIINENLDKDSHRGKKVVGALGEGKLSEFSKSEPHRPPRRKSKRDQVEDSESVVVDRVLETGNEKPARPIKDSTALLLHEVMKELPNLKLEQPVEESKLEISSVSKAESVPCKANRNKDTINHGLELESEIKPVIVGKPNISELTLSSGIILKEKLPDVYVANKSDSEDDEVVIVTNQKKPIDKASEPDEIGCIDEIIPEHLGKGDFHQAFDKILEFPKHTKQKDKDTISISSDISSTGSEAPPLPDTAPPPLLLFAPSLTPLKQVKDPVTEKMTSELEVMDTMDAEDIQNHESERHNLIPELSEKASPRELTSPIDELKASMFSMRVTSPRSDAVNGTRNEVCTNGELRIHTGESSSESDSDMSDIDDETVTGTFSPGENETNDVPTETNENDGGIQLISYIERLGSPNSDRSGPDSAFEDMQSSVTSNDPLSNTLDEFIVNEERVSAEKVVNKESTPEQSKEMANKFVLEFEDTARKRGGNVTSPVGSKDFLLKAQMFADVVQKPPKMTVKRKKEIATPEELSDERYIQLENERRAVISSSTMKKKDLLSPSEETPVEAPSTPDPDSSIQEWRSEVTKRLSVSWEEKPEKVNLYSENIIQETENTDTVDRESISDLNSIRQQWEEKFKTEQTQEKTVPKPKPPQQVRHWEVKLPTPLKKVPADVVRTTKSDSESEPETETMADTELSAESAIEREIRLATEREELLRKEQEERAKLQARQMAAAKKEPFEATAVEQNNNKPTFHEMTEADRGSELRQREDRIQQEMLEQQEREAAMRGQHEDSSSSSSEDDDNNESIIEREIRLQRERELELELRHKKHNARQAQDEEEEVVEETVETSHLEPAHLAPTTIRTPDEELSETNEVMSDLPQTRTRITYEEAISSAAHEGESLIARELREAREREEELHKQRERLATGATQGPKSADMSPRPRENETKSENQKPSYSKDVSPFKNGRSQSTDSLSSGNSSEKPQPVTPRITSFSSGGKIGGLNYTVPEKPKDAKRQETPIEREIRLARERENEYRVSKGLPPLEDVKKVDNYELDDDEKDMIVVRSSNQSTRAGGKDNIQRFASTRLQKEIDKQTEIEKKYLNEGKIKSTSEEHVGLVKYSEIAQDYSTTPKRNFSINKKGGSGSEPVTEQNGTTPDHKTAPKNSSPVQNVPKYNRSASSGVTFSYRESRHKAESNIEKELREMREREEELRSQRAVGGVVSPSSPRSPATSVVDKRSAFEQTS